jgi:hypothetical protein
MLNWFHKKITKKNNELYNTRKGKVNLLTTGTTYRKFQKKGDFMGFSKIIKSVLFVTLAVSALAITPVLAADETSNNVVSNNSDEAYIQCFWDNYYKQADGLIEQVVRLEHDMNMELDLGKRAGLRSDFLRAQNDLDLLTEKRKAMNFYYFHSNKTRLEAMKSVFGDVYNCANEK